MKNTINSWNVIKNHTPFITIQQEVNKIQQEVNKCVTGGYTRDSLSFFTTGMLVPYELCCGVCEVSHNRADSRGVAAQYILIG